MATAPKKVNAKGKEIKEYPKLVRVNDKKKVLVKSKEEEDKVLAEAKAEPKKEPEKKW